MNDKENGNQEEHKVSHQIICGECGGNEIETAWEPYKFPYGIAPSCIELECEVPVRRCEKCEFKFIDSEAERLCHEAVCLHLGVMNPEEIKSIRKSYGLTQDQFCEITQIGNATLSRWERGIVIQNKAYDSYLHLLQLQSNLRRVQLRNRSSEEFQVNIGQGEEGRFRALKRTREMEEKKNNFTLRPAVEA